jgi:hypothetical protein
MNEERLHSLFAQPNEDLPAGDFGERVLRRMRQRARVRRIVLTTAAMLGIALSFGPLLQVSLGAAHEWTNLVAQLIATDWLVEYRASLLIALLIAITPGLVRWLER